MINRLDNEETADLYMTLESKLNDILLFAALAIVIKLNYPLYEVSFPNQTPQNPIPAVEKDERQVVDAMDIDEPPPEVVVPEAPPLSAQIGEHRDRVQRWLRCRLRSTAHHRDECAPICAIVSFVTHGLSIVQRS